MIVSLAVVPGMPECIGLLSIAWHNIRKSPTTFRNSLPGRQQIKKTINYNRATLPIAFR
jgi:hypothetical protein